MSGPTDVEIIQLFWSWKYCEPCLRWHRVLASCLEGGEGGMYPCYWKDGEPYLSWQEPNPKEAIAVAEEVMRGKS